MAIFHILRSSISISFPLSTIFHEILTDSIQKEATWNHLINSITYTILHNYIRNIKGKGFNQNVPQHLAGGEMVWTRLKIHANTSMCKKGAKKTRRRVVPGVLLQAEISTPTGDTSWMQIFCYVERATRDGRFVLMVDCYIAGVFL